MNSFCSRDSLLSFRRQGESFRNRLKFIEKNELIKEFCTESFLTDCIDFTTREWVILASHVFDFDSSEDTSELTGSFEVPVLRESIDESCSERISASSSVDKCDSINGWNDYLIRLWYDNWSFITESDDSCMSSSLADMYEIFSRHLEELCPFWLIHDGDVSLAREIDELFPREYSHRLTGIKNSENPSICAFIHSANHPISWIRSNDGILECDIPMSELSRRTHSSRMEGIDLAFFFITQDIRLCGVASRNRLYEFRIDAHITESREIFDCIFPNRSDHIRILPQECKGIGNIRGGSTVFLAYHGREEWEMEVGIGPVILCTELSNCLYNRIEGYGSGDKERHNGCVNYKVYDIMYQILSFWSYFRIF